MLIHAWTPFLLDEERVLDEILTVSAQVSSWVAT